jgi:hypothetical protein
MRRSERATRDAFLHPYREEKAMKLRILLSLALCAALIGETSAQQYVYPAKGQSPEQQKKDEAACYQWAVQQTGFDPAKPQPQQQAATPPTTATGTTPGAGVRGAARGAVVARSRSRRENAAAQQQAQQQTQAASQQQQAGFAKARGACLEGRGYTVK